MHDLYLLRRRMGQAAWTAMSEAGGPCRKVWEPLWFAQQLTCSAYVAGGGVLL